MQRVSFVSAPANFLVQRCRNFDSKDLSADDLGKEFSRTLSKANAVSILMFGQVVQAPGANMFIKLKAYIFECSSCKCISSCKACTVQGIMYSHCAFLFQIIISLPTIPHQPPLSRPQYDIFSGALRTGRPYGALKVFHTPSPPTKSFPTKSP